MYASRTKNSTFDDKANEACYIAEADAREKGAAHSPMPPPEICTAIDAAIEATRGDLKFDFLATWISARDCVMPLIEAHDIEDAEIKRTEVSSVITRIRETHPEDFGVLRYFFEKVKDRKSFRVYELPKCVADKQSETLQEKSSNIYLCRSCGFIKHAIKGCSVRRNKYTYRMYTGLLSGKTFCSPYVPRKGLSAAAVARAPPLKNERFRNNRKGKEKQGIKREMLVIKKNRCIDTEVTRLDCLGACVSTKMHHNVMICPECGLLMQYDKKKFHDGLPNCGCNVDAPPAMRNEKRKRECADCGKETTSRAVVFLANDEFKPAIRDFCAEDLRSRTSELDFELTEESPSDDLPLPKSRRKKGRLRGRRDAILPTERFLRPPRHRMRRP